MVGLILLGFSFVGAEPIESEISGKVIKTEYIPQGADAGSELFPPNPRPGGCYTRVLVPAKYKTETITLLKSEASERLEIIPAVYETVEEKVLVKEASERLEIVPATYEWIEENVLVKEASERLEVVPAQYETVTEQVIDKPAHVIWEKGHGLIEKIDHTTGEILCLKEIPATYKTVSKRILKVPVTTRTIEIPAEYKIVKRQVMTNPPTTRKIEIPAEYKIQKVAKLVEPAKVNHIPIPEESQTVTKVVRVSEERMAWRPVLCETNITVDLIKQIQASLKERGFYKGSVDGDMGAGSQKAILKFQKDNGLSQGGLTAETLKALEIALPWLEELRAGR